MPAHRIASYCHPVGSNQSDVRDFLVSRRGRLKPEQAGLRHYGSNRRVPGLRREEVALLAGLSVDYYTRLERGNLTGVSETVLHAIADALQLDESERTYLFALFRAANASGRAPARVESQLVRPAVQLVLDGMTTSPAFVRNHQLDLLATNPLARALYSPVLDSAVARWGPHPNIARFHFLDPASPEFYPDWDAVADACVAILRTEAGRAPRDLAPTGLVEDLLELSADFRTRWAAHNVRLRRSGTLAIYHPAVGRLELDFEDLILAADGGLTLAAYAVEPGTAAADGLRLLESLAASQPDGVERTGQSPQLSV